MMTYLAKLKQEKEGFMTCFHDMNNKKSLQKLSEGSLSSSGWQDSNLRPPGPKPGTLTGLCYTPNIFLCNVPTHCVSEWECKSRSFLEF